MSHRRGAQRPVAMPPTAPRSRGGPSSAPSRFFRPPPPPPPPSQSDPFDFILEECGRSSAPSRFFRPPPPPPPPPSRSDPFDFILEECGRLSLSQEAHLRNAAPFLRQEKLNPANLPRDERALGYHILYRVFGFENPHHHRSRRPPYTDAEAAELALSDYFLALGPRRVHLLQTPPKEGKQARGTRRPSGTRAAAPEGMPPPAEVPPSRRLGAAAATPAAPAEGGKDKLAGMKRARDDFSKPPRSLSHHSHAAGERSSMGKKTCANPDPVNPPAGRSSPGAGVTSTGDAPAVGGRPSSADGGGRRRRNLPPSILCPDDWEDARTGYERGTTRLRPVPPPPQVDQTPEKADPLEELAKGAFSMPGPKWWSPGGYGGRSTPPDK